MQVEPISNLSMRVENALRLASTLVEGRDSTYHLEPFL